MATISFQNGALFDLEKLDLTEKDIKAAIDAGGMFFKPKVQAATRQYFTRDRSATHIAGQTASGTELKKAKRRGSDYAAYITFNGTRADGWFNTSRRIAEVAFVNEYGASSHGIVHKPIKALRWLEKTTAQNEEAVIQKIEDSLPKV